MQAYSFPGNRIKPSLKANAKMGGVCAVFLKKFRWERDSRISRNACPDRAPKGENGIVGLALRPGEI